MHITAKGYESKRGASYSTSEWCSASPSSFACFRLNGALSGGWTRGVPGEPLCRLSSLSFYTSL